jgi:DNA invertase Pin-like site-specific DNA recombinase
MQRVKRVALYLRVSTDEQTTANQRRELEAVAAHKGWIVTKVFEDVGVSGAKGRDKRPGFDAMLKAVTRGEIDLVAAWAVDRLGRSLQHLIETLSELQAAKVDLYLHQQSLDTSTPAGMALFQMLGVFAQFERSMIVSRVTVGMARAKANGTKSGKAIGRPKVSKATETAIRAELAKGTGILKTAKMLRVGSSTVQKVKHAMAA